MARDQGDSHYGASDFNKYVVLDDGALSHVDIKEGGILLVTPQEIVPMDDNRSMVILTGLNELLIDLNYIFQFLCTLPTGEHCINQLYGLVTQ